MVRSPTAPYPIQDWAIDGKLKISEYINLCWGVKKRLESLQKEFLASKKEIGSQNYLYPAMSESEINKKHNVFVTNFTEEESPPDILFNFSKNDIEINWMRKMSSMITYEVLITYYSPIFVFGENIVDWEPVWKGEWESFNELWKWCISLSYRKTILDWCRELINTDSKLYYGTLYWMIVKKTIRGKQKNICAKCENICSLGEMCVHHNDYDHLGFELLSENRNSISGWCRSCHDNEHPKYKRG